MIRVSCVRYALISMTFCWLTVIRAAIARSLMYSVHCVFLRHFLSKTTHSRVLSLISGPRSAIAHSRLDEFYTTNRPCALRLFCSMRLYLMNKSVPLAHVVIMTPSLCRHVFQLSVDVYFHERDSVHLVQANFDDVQPFLLILLFSIHYKRHHSHSEKCLYEQDCCFLITCILMNPRCNGSRGSSCFLFVLD